MTCGYPMMYLLVFLERGGRGIKLKEKREILAVPIDLTKQITQPVWYNEENIQMFRALFVELHQICTEVHLPYIAKEWGLWARWKGEYSQSQHDLVLVKCSRICRKWPSPYNYWCLSQKLFSLNQWRTAITIYKYTGLTWLHRNRQTEYEWTLVKMSAL